MKKKRIGMNPGDLKRGGCQLSSCMNNEKIIWDHFVGACLMCSAAAVRCATSTESLWVVLAPRPVHNAYIVVLSHVEYSTDAVRLLHPVCAVSKRSVRRSEPRRSGGSFWTEGP
jgi:hypothetical protein